MQVDMTVEAKIVLFSSVHASKAERNKKVRD